MSTRKEHAAVGVMMVWTGLNLAAHFFASAPRLSAGIWQSSGRTAKRIRIRATLNLASKGLEYRKKENLAVCTLILTESANPRTATRRLRVSKGYGRRDEQQREDKTV